MRRRNARQCQLQCTSCLRGSGRRLHVQTLDSATREHLKLWAQKRGTARGRRYDAYLDSPEWRARRKKLFDERGKVCQNCGATEFEEVMTLHHVLYEEILDETKDEDLRVWCLPCNVGEREARHAGFLPRVGTR